MVFECFLCVAGKNVICNEIFSTQEELTAHMKASEKHSLQTQSHRLAQVEKVLDSRSPYDDNTDNPGALKLPYSLKRRVTQKVGPFMLMFFRGIKR